MYRIYVTNAFKGHYPVGTAAVVIAENRIEATRLLGTQLKEQHNLELKGLNGQEFDPNDFHEIELDREDVIILTDGDY